MDTATVYELIGYLGSGLVVVSLMMSSLLRLRVVNLVGALVFGAYGVLIDAPPVWIVNGAIVVIDVWHLWRMLRTTEDLEVLEVPTTSTYLSRFLEHHADDIAGFVPSFDGLRRDHRAFFVLRDLVPAAVVVVRPGDGDELQVDLDYAIPAYRDFTSGAYVFDDADLFTDLGATAVTTDPGSEEHQRYLRRMGFTPAGDRWRRSIRPSPGAARQPGS